MQTGNFFCALLLILLLIAAMIALGYINIFRKDTAWQIAAWSLRIVKPHRTPAWERDSTIRGVILLAAGLLWLLGILYLLLK
jgi:hypothetical protein